MLDFIRLFYSDADTNTVHARFNEDLLVFVPGNRQGVEDKFWRATGFDLGYIVPFGGLRCEVGHCKGSGQGRPNALEIGAQGLRLEVLDLTATISSILAYHGGETSRPTRDSSLLDFGELPVFRGRQ